MVSFLPPAVSLAYGDAVHNMRSALDLLAIDVVAQSGGSTKGVYFPFAEDKTGLNEMIKRKKFHRATQEAQDLLWAHEPFKGGNGLLRGLHDLDIMEKHQVILPVSPVIEVEEVVFHFASGPAHRFRTQKASVDAAQRMPSLPICVQTKSLGMAAVFMNEAPSVFHSKVLLETLHGLVQYLDGLIEAFATLFGRHGVEVPSLGPVFQSPALIKRPTIIVRDFITRERFHMPWHVQGPLLIPLTDIQDNDDRIDE